MGARPPILQFGTGRFLQAHVDLFVSQALERGEAIGGIAVVQSTDSAQSHARLAAMATGQGYRVDIRGLLDGEVIEQTVPVHSIQAAFHAQRDWPRVIEAAVWDARVIVSNTADRGYELFPEDSAELLWHAAAVPRSYPAKLLVLLHRRWLREPVAPLSIYPCELVSRNGDSLKQIVSRLAGAWQADPDFVAWLGGHCVWVNSLVDRIVSAPIEPAGAIAEPFALWAIERQDRMVLPCAHPAIVLTDSLGLHERLKLHLLNLAHSCLAELWLVGGGAADRTVLQSMGDPATRSALEALWLEEVLPVFEADGEGGAARDYLAGLRDRLLNPFLQHRLADIAGNHEEKKRRRFGPLIARARELGLHLPQPFLKRALGRIPDVCGPA